MSAQETTPAMRELDDPVLDAANEAFWGGTAKDQLLVKRCKECAKLHWYPRALCPYCMGETEWIESTGKGQIYSVSITRRAGPVVYAMAYVTLDEGLTLLTNIVDCDFDALRIGDRVKVTFKATPNGAKAPMFTPDR